VDDLQAEGEERNNIVELFPNARKSETSEAKVAKKLKEVQDEVRRNVGIDIGAAELNNLSPGVLGQVHIQSGLMEFDNSLLPANDNQRFVEYENVIDIQKFRHVAHHEAFHKRKKIGFIIDVRFEEALTELASESHTGQTIAYPAEIQFVRGAFRQAGISMSTALSWYRSGNCESINRVIIASYINQAANDNGSKTISVGDVVAETRKNATAVGERTILHR